MTKLTLKQQEVIIENIELWCNRVQNRNYEGTCTFCNFFVDTENYGEGLCVSCPFTLLNADCASRHDLGWRVATGEIEYNKTMSLTEDELKMSAEEHGAAIVDYLCIMFDLGT